MNRNYNGDGSFFLASTGRYVYQYTEPITHKVKRITQKKNETRKDFKDRANKIRAEINTDEYIAGSKTTIESIIEEQNQILYRANKIKPISYKRRTETLNQIKQMAIASMPIQEVSANLINEDLTTIVNYSDSTISKIYSMLSSAFDYAVSYNIIKSSPFRIKNIIIKPKSTQGKKKVEALTIEEQKKFEQELAKGYDTFTTIFYILLYTGARVGEVLALTGEDIDLKNKIIHINKTLTKSAKDKTIIGKTTKTYAGTRDVPIINKLMPLLPTTINSELLFTNNGKIINPSTINIHFKKICKNAGICVVINANKKKVYKGKETRVNLKTSEVHTHMLRHTFATRCIEAGMNVVTLSKVLGHKDVQTTLNTYISVFNQFQNSELKKVEEYLDKI